MLLAVLFVLTCAPLDALAVSNADIESSAPEAPLSAEALTFPGAGTGNGGRVVEEGLFPLTQFTNLGRGKNGLAVEWDAYPFGASRYDLAFLYYQRMKNEDGTWTEWETRSTHEARPLNVLVISPSNATSNSATGITRRVEGWLNQADVDPDGLLNVRTVTARMFREGRWPETAVSNTVPTVHPDGPNHILIDPATGRYRFDVIVIGTADLNGGNTVGANFSATVIDALNSFLDSGRGILFGHDTFFSRGSNISGLGATLPGVDGDAAVTNWNYQLAPLANRAGVIPTTKIGLYGHNVSATESSMRVELDGVLTQYPNRVSVGQVLPVPQTHNNGAATRGTVWARITNRAGALGSNGVPTANAITTHINNGTLLPGSTQGNLLFMHNGARYQTNAYLSTYQNTAHIQTGHTASGTTQAERRILANTVFFLSQLTFDNYFTDHSAIDWAAPERPKVELNSIANDGITTTVHVSAEDLGTVYQGNVVGLSQLEHNPPAWPQPNHEEGRFRSHTYEETVTSGTKGYFLTISSNPNGTPFVPTDEFSIVDFDPANPQLAQRNTTVVLHDEDIDGALHTFEMDWNRAQDLYMHIVAVDHANNISDVRSIPLADLRVGLDIEVVERLENGTYVPVPNAQLQIGTTPAPTNVVTGLNGKVFVPMSSWGTYPIIAMANTFDANIAFATINQTAPLAQVRIVMERGERVMIWGRATDAQSGLPIAGAKVQVPALTIDPETGAPVANPSIATVSTNEQGFYYIRGRGTGTYTVVASASDYNSVAATVRVPDMNPVRQDFALTQQPPTRLVYGMVREFPGSNNPMPDVSVTVGTARTMTDDWGFYAVSIPEPADNRTSLMGSKLGYTDYENPDVELSSEPFRYDFNMTTRMGGTVIVTVWDDARDVTLPNAKVTLFGRTVTTDTDGTATFENIPTDRSYHVLAQSPGFNAGTATATVGSVGTYPVEIRLTPGNLGAIQGQVRSTADGAGVPGALVRSVATDPSGNALYATIADDWGFYVITDIPSGVYTMIASADKYNAAAHMVEIRPNVFTTQDFWLTPYGGEIPQTFLVTGWVETDAGVRLQGATVRTDGGAGQLTQTDSLGYYVLTGFLPNTSNALIAFRDGFAGAREVVMIAEEDAVQNFVLRSTVWINIRGIVREAGSERSLYNMRFPFSAAAGEFEIHAIHMPGYRVVTASPLTIDPSVFPSDGTITFEYVDNMTSVTIRARYLVPGSAESTDVELEEFVSFEVPAEIGEPFFFDGVPPMINGFTFTKRGAPIPSVAADGSSVFYLYYMVNWADMVIEAREARSGDLLTTSGLNLELNDVVTITDTGYERRRGDEITIGVARPLPEEDAREEIFTGMERDALRFFNLIEGSGRFEGFGAESFTFNGVGAPPRMVFDFERMQVTARVVLLNADTGEEIVPRQPIPPLQVPMGIPYDVAAPVSAYVPTSFTLLPGMEIRTVAVMNESDTEITVPFYYSPNENAATVTVRAIGIDIDGVTERMIGEFAVIGTVGEETTIAAPDFTGAGWILNTDKSENPGRVLVTEEGANIIIFYYDRDAVTVTIRAIVVEGENEVDISNLIAADLRTVPAARNFAATITAPHIDGYVLAGEQAKLFQPITQDETVTFRYTPIEDILEEYTVVLTVVGRAGSTELYRYNVVRARGSGAYTVTAFEPTGYALIGDNTYTFNVGTEPETYVFTYDSLATRVQIRAVDAQSGDLLPNFTPFYAPAVMGQPFSYTAPYIPNFNLVGALSQTLETVTAENDTLTFAYERGTGNVTVVLREVDAAGKVLGALRSESVNLEADIPTLIPVPVLENFTALSTAETVTFTGTPLVVEYDYRKDLADVVVRAMNGDKEIGRWTETDIRLGEVSGFAARPMDGYALRDTTPKLVMVTEAGQVIDFQYEPATNDQVIVEAILTEGGAETILYGYVMTARTGSAVTVDAPELLGFRLQNPAAADQTATAPGTIRFLYVRDEVRVTVHLVNDNTDAALTAPTGFPTSIKVSRGGDVTVFAPHIPGFVITGTQNRFFPNLTTDASVTFRYTPIEDLWPAVEGFSVTYLPGKGQGAPRIVEDVVARHTLLSNAATGFEAPKEYEFDGWYVDNAGVLLQAGDEITVDRDLTIVAQWRLIEDEEECTCMDEHECDECECVCEICEEKEKADGERQAYLIGSGNGQINPNGNITRAEVATIFFRLISDGERAEFWTQQNPFPDVAINDWFNNAVSTTTNMDLFQGVGDGTFAPNRTITRAELATVIVRFMAVADNTPPVQNQFNDIAGHWAGDYINLAAANGWVNGIQGLGGPFQPDRPITRAEVAAMVNRIFHRLPETRNDLLPNMRAWMDNLNPDRWFYLHMQAASNSYTYVMKENGINETWIEIRAPRDWTVLERPDSRPGNILAASPNA